MASDAACTYAAGVTDSRLTPFKFTTSETEVGPPVKALRSELYGGLCYFPDAVGCSLSQEMQSHYDSFQNWNTVVMMVVCMVPLIIWRYSQSSAAYQDHGAPESCVSRFRLTLMILMISAEVYVNVNVNKVVQLLLPVALNNVTVAVGAFLGPVEGMFQFLEDAATVKITQAMAKGDKAAARTVLMIGVFGGYLTGMLAAGLATWLVQYKGFMHAVLDPSGVYDRQHLAGCSAMPSDLLELGKTFYLVTAWRWPLAFMNMTLRGFFLGAQEHVSWCVTSIVQCLISAYGVLFVFADSPSIELLAWIGFVEAAAGTLLYSANFVIRRDIRERYLGFSNLSEMWTRASHGNASAEQQLCDKPAEAPGTSSTWETWRDTIVDGFNAMVLDVSQQLCGTIAIFLAAPTMGLGGLYQLSAVGKAYPQFGMAYVGGVTYMLKIRGARLIGAGDFTGFRKLFNMSMVYVPVMIVAASATVMPSTNVMAFGLGQQGCQLAREEACLPAYNSMFGGGVATGEKSLQSLMKIFPLVLAGLSAMDLMKACLYSCFDFAFMAKAGVAVLVMIFVPLAYLAAVVFKTSVAFLVAIYVPFLCIGVVFCLRMRVNLRKMICGEDGPWTSHLQLETNEKK